MKPIENRVVYLSLLLILVLGFQTGPLPPPNSSVEWQSKVDPWVLDQASQGETEFLLLLREQADLSGAAALENKAEKGRFVFERLTEVAERTQPALHRELEANGLTYRSYWIANMIWVRGGLAVVENLARRSDVAHLYANPWVRQAEPKKSELMQPDSAEAPTTIEWNLLKINADDVWAAGFTGQGAVVAGQDTGYDWTHPALKDKYRGWDGFAADHNYNWHDAIHSEVPGSSPGNSCGYNSPVPCDDDSHGTHTMGTMVGDDGGTNQIGVAPGAKWIGCRNMDDGWGAPATYSECYQWFLAPTDLNGLNPRPDLAPDVINNSWSCPPTEGCTDPNVLLTVVNNVRAAGILTVHSAGNSGSGCETVNTPAAIYDASFTVGNTTSTDTISSSSSRGPVTVDGSGRMKPDISAPGTSIRSSIAGGGYASYSGTSMAGPHVAGMAALLISAQPSLAGEVDQLEQMIRSSAIPLSNTQTCGGIPAGQVPNNVFGYGRIDALNGILLPQHLMTIQKTASSSTIASGSLLTYTLSVSHQHTVSPTFNVIVSDTLPLGSEFISAAPGYMLDGRTVTWQFPEMAAGESQEMELVVRVDEFFSGVLTNELYTARSDEVPAIFGPPVTTTVQGYGLELVKQAPDVIFGGELLTYTLQAHNTHPTLPQHNLVITDRLPITTSFFTATMPYLFDGEIIRWEFPALDPEAVKQVELVVSLPITATGTIENKTYTAWTDQVSTPVSGPPAFTQIQALPGLEMSTGALSFVRSGGLLAITRTLTNTTAAEVAVELQLISEQSWTQTDLTPFTLGPGATKLLTILVNIPQDAAAGTLETIALIARSQSNPLVFARVDDYVQVPYLYFFPITRKAE